MNEQFTGQGWAYPCGADLAGGVALASGADDVAQAIFLILSTAYGERPMRPGFGCGIHDYVFAPINSETMSRLADEVRLALQRWEPRIDLSDVRVSPDAESSSTLYIDIEYRLSGSNDPRNLVFPFYVIRPED